MLGSPSGGTLMTRSNRPPSAPHGDAPPGAMTIGAFARASRLSQKALRLYNELGLLVPVYVAPETGYRFYVRSQLEPAHLIARLRDLGLPLSEVAAVLDAASPDRSALLARLWARHEHEHQRRAALARYVIESLVPEGEFPMTTLSVPVSERYTPAQQVVSITVHTYVQGLGEQIDRACTRLGEVLAAAGRTPEGPALVLYHGEVNTDSDGPIEVCLPCSGPLEVPDSVALRTEPAHHEVYVQLTRAQFEFPGILQAYEQTARRAKTLGTLDLSPREVYTHDWHHTGPDEVAGEVATPYLPS